MLNPYAIFKRAALRLQPAYALVFAVLMPVLNADAQKPAQGSEPPVRGVKTVILGNATVQLTGPWSFHIGDDMAWAQPQYDDSGWGAMDLTPPPGSYDPLIGSSGFVPGWTVRGYPGYSGYAWYRLRVNVRNEDQGAGRARLALKMPDNFDDAYQVYVNGKLVGQFGRFGPGGLTVYPAQPRAFTLPAYSGETLTIAIRMWMDAFTPMVDPDVGGLHGPPVLGEAAVIDGLLKLDWDAVDRSFETDFVEVTVLVLALMLACVLYWLDREEPAYLWLGLTFVPLLARAFVTILTSFTTILGADTFLYQDAFLSPATIGLWVIFWAYWFRLERMDRMHRTVWSLVALLGAATAMLRAPLYGRVIPVHAIVWLSPLTLVIKLLLGALLVWVTYRGIEKNKSEGWLALPAVLLVFVSNYQEEMIALHISAQFFPFGVAVSLQQLGVIFSLGIISWLLVWRFIRGQREREQWRLEIEQAREVQQVLIPEANPTIPGFTLESEYRPAQQVGGDFFQILSDGGDGALIVLGDVTGKGLQAGMLVSLLVGAIRTIVETSYEPSYVLQALNRRLCGRSQAHATCLALHVDRNGEVKLANAGHLAPYVNGEEVALKGSLPLGLTEQAHLEETQLTLRPGDLLTAMTDGVVEAVNANRELFGFARAQAISRQDAASIVRTAQDFGQEDDITVVSISRQGMAEPTSAPVKRLTTQVAGAQA